MKNLVLELKRKKEEELNYQLSKSSDKLYYTPNELTDWALEVQYSDARIDMIDEIIFFLENNVWENEMPAKVFKN